MNSIKGDLIIYVEEAGAQRKAPKLLDKQIYVLKMATDNENEDSWLYDNDSLKEASENRMDSRDAEKEELEKLEAMDDGNLDKNVNGTKHGNSSTEGQDIHDYMESDDVAGNNNHMDDNYDNKSDFDDSGDDDVEVTLNSINEIYDKYPSQSGGMPVGVPSSLSTTGSMKPPAKGIDVDAIGNIKGVHIYEYDLNSIKIDEKPWRKPGADITDYFNYGFTEDTWMKYCEKQRRMRLENNCRTGLIVGNGQISGEATNDLDATYLGLNRRQPGQRMSSGVIGQGGSGSAKSSGLIDVIGSTQRDSRRPQQEFNEISTSQSPATSVATVMPISMSIPPPMLNMPPPDFAIPPPSSLPPGALGHPVIGPPGIIGHPPILVAPPPNYAPPPMAGQFDPFFRPPIIGGPPPSAVNHSTDRRGVPGFPDRPPFRMESIYGAPPTFQGPPGLPPHWDSRKMTLHQDERPLQWGRSGSRSRESEISSSSTEDNSGQKSVEKFETTDRKSPAYSREESRHRSHDRSRHHEYERDRSTRDRDRRRDYEGSRSSRHSRHRGYRDDERSSRHYSSRRRDKSPQDEYKSSTRYSSRKHRHDKSRSSSSTSDKERRKSRTCTPEHK